MYIVYKKDLVRIYKKDNQHKYVGKLIFYNFRTIYLKKGAGNKKYIRYKNRYYRVYATSLGYEVSI